MSKKGNYIGGSTVVSKNSSFFRVSKENKELVSPKDLKKAKRKILEVKKGSYLCINTNYSFVGEGSTPSEAIKHFETQVSDYKKK